MHFRKPEITKLLALFLKLGKNAKKVHVNTTSNSSLFSNKLFLLLFTLTIIEPNVQSSLLLTKAFRFSWKHLASYFYQNDLDITESFNEPGFLQVALSVIPIVFQRFSNFWSPTFKWFGKKYQTTLHCS